MLFPAYTQSIRDAVDVIEPGSNQGDLENRLIIKAGASQALVIALRDARRVTR